MNEMENNMHHILLALGSNTRAEENIREAQAYLTATFPNMQFSRLLSTPAIGIVSPPFINCMAQAHCSVEQVEVLDVLKSIEVAMGSTNEDRKKNVVVIDIDLLQFDNERRKTDDWDRDYTQLLYKELCCK